MASSSDRKLSSSASRAPKPTFRRAGAKASSGAMRPSRPVSNAPKAVSKPKAPVRQRPNSSKARILGGSTAAHRSNQRPLRAPAQKQASHLQPRLQAPSRPGASGQGRASLSARPKKVAKPRTFTAIPVKADAKPTKPKGPIASVKAGVANVGAASPVGAGKVLGLVVAALAVLVVAAVIVVNSGLFAATDVQIKGSEHITQHDAKQLIDLPQGTSLFNVDTSKIVDDLKQNPWVSGVDVQREFPHTLVITPTERKVLAIAYITSDDIAWAIGDDDTWIAPLSTSVAVDDKGEMVTSGDGAKVASGIDAALALAKHYGAVLLTDVSADVSPVSGQTVSSKPVKAGLDYARGFSSDFLSQVKDISVSSVEAISANLDSGVEVSLGEASDISKKEKIVTKLLSQVEGVTYINVRSSGNYTFRNAPTS